MANQDAARPQSSAANLALNETEINRLYRATKLLEIGAGTTEIRKLIIAAELMRPASSE